MLPKRERKNFTHWLKSKWFIVGIFVILVMISGSLIKEFIRGQQIKKEISDLEQQVSKLQGENEDMSDFVAYLKTDRYFEEQARLKLSKKSEGEKVIVIENDNTSAGRDKFDAYKISKTGNRSNVDKWFAYFFGN